MGKAVNHITDPLGIIPDKIQEMDVVSRTPVLDLLEEVDRNGAGHLQGAGAELATGTATNTGPLPSPYRRPRANPLTAQQQYLDRRRSIASAMRRRRGAASILGGTPPAADPLGAA